MDDVDETRSSLAMRRLEIAEIQLNRAQIQDRRNLLFDLLEWDSFLWEASVVRVQATQYFDAKTEDSLGDVAVDDELLELFRGYRARATSSFVIESDNQPKPGADYWNYRCQDVFDCPLP